jgi:ribosome-associated protein
MDKVYINTDFIKLQQALKLANVVGQGSDAKLIIQDGAVKVNGEVCLMRGKKLVKGDVVEFDEYRFEIDSKDE